MIVKIWILFTLILFLDGASSSFRKCCPIGEVFSGVSEVDCVPTPQYATELYTLDFTGENVTSDGFPVCEKPQDISTIPLDNLKPSDFLQEPSCLEILHEQNTHESVPIIVHCHSNEDRSASDPSKLIPSASLPRLLNVRRCCTNYTVYNVNTGNCETMNDIVATNNSYVDDFLSMLPKGLEKWDFLNVHKGVTKCSGAIFTYAINLEDLSFVDGVLKVTLPSRINETDETFAIAEENVCLELSKDSQETRQLVIRVCRNKEYCLNYDCISKCCAEGYHYYKSRCTEISERENAIEFYEGIANYTGRPWDATEYGLSIGLACPDGAFILRPNEMHGMTSKGYILTEPGNRLLNQSQYCMEVFDNDVGFQSLNTFVCFEPSPEEKDTRRFVVNSILEGISCFFLLLTLIVYCCLPALQNLHGKTLMCHAASLFVAYACVCIIPWVTPDKHLNGDELGTLICSALGFIMLFAFLSAFCWLNVMCFDIWRTFGSLRGNMSRGQSHGKKFLCYCLYAWGLSMFITILGIMADTTNILPENVRPDLGSVSCWFTDYPEMYGELVFFRGPVAIQLTFNVIFFILTAEQCSKVKAEIRRVADPMDPRNKRFHANKTKFIMNVKLFIVMGISWIAELLSSFVSRYTSYQWREEMFYATDVLNCLQGLLIFLLFVMKRRVHHALMTRLGFETKKKCSSHGTSMLQDPYKVKKSASNSTLTSSFAVSVAP